MKIITTALEKEGYGPNQATVDEVIRYLWWKKERNDVELSETKETLAALGGEEPRQAFKVHQIVAVSQTLFGKSVLCSGYLLCVGLERGE